MMRMSDPDYEELDPDLKIRSKEFIEEKDDMVIEDDDKEDTFEIQKACAHAHQSTRGSWRIT